MAFTVLRNLDTVVLPHKPRMADFARWVVAADAAFDLPEDLRARAG